MRAVIEKLKEIFSRKPKEVVEPRRQLARQRARADRLQEKARHSQKEVISAFHLAYFNSAIVSGAHGKIPDG